MSTSQVISILAVVIPSGTALLVAYWHRKQARQLEAFRRDPAVGLNPPPSALWVHFRKNWQLWQILIGIVVQVVCLVSTLRSTDPITRGTIVGISAIVGAILWNLVMGFIQIIFRQITQVAQTQSTIVATIGQQTETIKLIGDIAEIRGQLAAPRKCAGDAT